MSSFGDELRNLIAKKADQLLARDLLAERAAEAEKRKGAELEAAAEALVRDVFRPLMEEFSSALLAAGVFTNSNVSDVVVEPMRVHICTAACHGHKCMYRIRFFAAPLAPIAAGRIALAATAEFSAQRSEVGSSWRALFDTANAASTADSSLPAGYPLGGSTLPVPIVEIAPKSIAPDPASLAAEQWCRAALKKIAATCVEAERGGKRS